MPCRTDDDQDRMDWNARQLKKVEAMLCGVLTFLEEDVTLNPVLDSLNYSEMGVTRDELDFWWRDHKAKDAARRKIEAEKRKQESLKASALSKLTIEERKALGL